MLRKLALKFLPYPFLAAAYRTLVFGIPDIWDAVFGGREALVPPRRMIFIGTGHYKATGDEFLRYFIQFGDITPQSAVLDVGSGIGRMALPLTSYLSPQGRYEGFDIDAHGIRWCQKNFTPRFPNFNFQCADIYNKMYNPRGKVVSTGYVFPYPGDSFDFVFLTSVFTHMFPDDVSHYISEISRVLKPGGRVLATFFLSNEESRRLVESGKSVLDLSHEVDGYFTVNPDLPEGAISLRESFVRDSHEKYGLQIETIKYGNWCGRVAHTSYQDMVVARKPDQN